MSKLLALSVGNTPAQSPDAPASGCIGKSVSSASTFSNAGEVVNSAKANGVQALFLVLCAEQLAATKTGRDMFPASGGVISLPNQSVEW